MVSFFLISWKSWKIYTNSKFDIAKDPGPGGDLKRNTFFRRHDNGKRELIYCPSFIQRLVHLTAAVVGSQNTRLDGRTQEQRPPGVGGGRYRGSGL